MRSNETISSLSVLLLLLAIIMSNKSVRKKLTCLFLFIFSLIHQDPQTLEQEIQPRGLAKPKLALFYISKEWDLGQSRGIWKSSNSEISG